MRHAHRYFGLDGCFFFTQSEEVRSEDVSASCSAARGEIATSSHVHCTVPKIPPHTEPITQICTDLQQSACLSLPHGFLMERPEGDHAVMTITAAASVDSRGGGRRGVPCALPGGIHGKSLVCRKCCKPAMSRESPFLPCFVRTRFATHSIVHQQRSSPVGGKKMSSILLALHEPMRVPPVILVFPKISRRMMRHLQPQVSMSSNLLSF